MKGEAVLCDGCSRTGRQTLASDALTLRSASGREWHVDLCAAHLAELVGGLEGGAKGPGGAEIWQSHVLARLRTTPGGGAQLETLAQELGTGSRDRQLRRILRTLVAAQLVVVHKQRGRQIVQLVEAGPPTNGGPPPRVARDGRSVDALAAALLGTLRRARTPVVGTAVRTAIGIMPAEMSRWLRARESLRRAGLLATRGVGRAMRYHLTAKGRRAAGKAGKPMTAD